MGGETLTLMCTPGAFRITFAMLLHYIQYSGFTVCKLLSDCTDMPFILFCTPSLLNRATELLRLWGTMFTCRTIFFFLHCYCFYSAFHGFASASQVLNTPYIAVYTRMCNIMWRRYQPQSSFLFITG